MTPNYKAQPRTRRREAAASTSAGAPCWAWSWQRNLVHVSIDAENNVPDSAATFDEFVRLGDAL